MTDPPRSVQDIFVGSGSREWWTVRVGLALALSGCGDGDGAVLFDAAIMDAAIVDAARSDAATGCVVTRPDRVTVCGQLYDMETGERIEAPDATGALCDPNDPTEEGPCSITVQLYDPLMYVADPVGSAPTMSASRYVGEAGQFCIIDAVRPFNGFVALVTDDAGDADRYLATIDARPVEPGQAICDVRAYVTRHETDAAWTSSAGDPFGGQTFGEVGVAMLVFVHAGAPVAGVTATCAEPLYFADAEPGTRGTVDPSAESTGNNGAALCVQLSLGSHGGAGAEPAGCEWPEDLVGTVPGAVWYHEVIAHLAGDPDQACP